MYLRYDGDTLVFVPEDGPQRNVTLAGSQRATDPPQRRGWVRMLPAIKQADALLRAYLGERIERGQKAEKIAIRSFLRAINAVCSGGNTLGVRLKIRAAIGQRNTMEIYAALQGPERIEWLPAIWVEANDRLAHIMRETGPDRSLFGVDHLTTPARDLEAEGRRVIPPKVETQLVPGKKL